MVKKSLKVEIADTPNKHQMGLMFREKMENDEGMLFKFDFPQKLKFWGVNTYIPLSIAFVDENNVIIKISSIKPGDSSCVSSDKECDRAIEANIDFFEKNKIKTGDKIDISYDDDPCIINFNNR